MGGFRRLEIGAFLLLRVLAAPRECGGAGAPIFANGFESGNACSWSATAPSSPCVPPVPTLFLLNGSSGYPVVVPVTNSVAALALQASSASATAITHFCIRHSMATPAPDDVCWRPVPGVPAPTLEIAGEPVRLGFVPALVTLYAFVRDVAGRVSTLLPGSGGEGKDRARAQYEPGAPPAVGSFFVTASPDACPEFSVADLDTTTSPDLYLRWNVQFPEPGGPGNDVIDVEYTTDDLAFVAMAGSPLVNAVDDECSPSTCGDVISGCYVLQNHGLPTSYVRFRLKARDAKGNVTVRSSYPSLNVADKLRFLAGNPDPGIGGSARSAVFNHGATQPSAYVDPRTLVVNLWGAVFFLDRANGVLWVDPSTGLLARVAPTTGVATDGPLPGATFVNPVGLFMTHEGDVLVWDGQSIRRIVVDANGIPDLLETVTDAPPGSCHACNIVALPGGDFYFVNGLGLPGVSGWRIYRSTGGVVGAIAPSGTGYSGDPAAQIGTCLLRDLFVSYDPADGSVRRLHAAVLASGDCALYGYVSMDAAGVSVTTEDAAAVHLPFPSLTSSFAFTGLDGFVYGYWESGDSQLTRFDDRTSVSLDVLGSSGSLAQGCASGTPALECDARAHDVFVGPDGGVLWSSLGRIRAIEFDGRAVDFLGQSLDYGEDGDALAVRIAYSSTLGVWNDGLNERVTYLDNVNARIREAIVGGNVLRRAGNGVLGLPQAGGSDAPNEPLYLHAYSSFLQDPDGTIYLPSFQQILSNTDPASPWQTFAGLGEIPYWQADDDTPGDQLLLDFYDAIPFGSTPNRVAFAMLRWSGVEFTDGMVKSFARSDGALRHVAGVDGGIGPTCADGVSRTECSLFMHYYVWARTRAVYDAPRARWIWQGSWGDDEFLLFDDDGDGGPPGALKGSLGAQLGLASLRSWTYRFEDPYDVLYVCNGEGRLAKATLDGGVWTIQALPWPIASLSCAGQDLAWSSDGKRLVFPYRQFGLGGIAAYVIDP